MNNKVVDGRLVRPGFNFEITGMQFPGRGELQVKYGIQRDPMTPVYRIGNATPRFERPVTPMCMTLEFTYRREWLQLKALVEPGDLPRRVNEVRSIDLLIRNVKAEVEKDLDDGVSLLVEFTDHLKMIFRLWLEKMEVKFYHELEHEYTHTRH